MPWRGIELFSNKNKNDDFEHYLEGRWAAWKRKCTSNHPKPKKLPEFSPSAPHGASGDLAEKHPHDSDRRSDQ